MKNARKSRRRECWSGDSAYLRRRSTSRSSSSLFRIASAALPVDSALFDQPLPQLEHRHRLSERTLVEALDRRTDHFLESAQPFRRVLGQRDDLAHRFDAGARRHLLRRQIARGCGRHPTRAGSCRCSGRRRSSQVEPEPRNAIEHHARRPWPCAHCAPRPRGSAPCVARSFHPASSVAASRRVDFPFEPIAGGETAAARSRGPGRTPDRRRRVAAGRRCRRRLSTAGAIELPTALPGGRSSPEESSPILLRAEGEHLCLEPLEVRRSSGSRGTRLNSPIMCIFRTAWKR